MAKYGDVNLDLNEVNNSELVALCRWVGVPAATRAWPREVLLDTLQSFNPPGVKQSFSGPRESMSKWLRRYWSRIQMQVQKKVCPDCHLCGEVQFLACYVRNRKHFQGPKV